MQLNSKILLNYVNSDGKKSKRGKQWTFCAIFNGTHFG